MIAAQTRPVVVIRPSDEDLLRQIKRADQTAFEQLYDRYGSDLLNYLVYLTGDPAVTEELLQETWLAAGRQLSGRGAGKDLAAAHCP